MPPGATLTVVDDNLPLGVIKQEPEPAPKKEPTNQEIYLETVKELRVKKGHDAPEAAKENKPAPATTKEDEQNLYVDGDTPEDIETEVLDLAAKLGLDEKDTTILLNANFKKRWTDTRKSFNERSTELNELKKKQAEGGLPEKEAAKAAAAKVVEPEPAATDDDDFADLPEETRQVLEDTPELLDLFKATAKKSEARAKKMLEEFMASRDQAQTTATLKQQETRAEQDWRTGVESEIPGGLAMYASPEFIAWEDSNKKELQSLIGHYDKHDPLGTVEEIRLYQKYIQSNAKQQVDDERKDMRLSVSQPKAGHPTPQSGKRGQAADDDLAAMYKEAVAEVRKAKGYK